VNLKKRKDLPGICLMALLVAAEPAMAENRPTNPPLPNMLAFPTTLQDTRFQAPLTRAALSGPSAPTQTQPLEPGVPPDYLSPDMLSAAGRFLKELPSIASTMSRLRCTGFQLHSAHHQFPMLGERCHLQMNCYLKGVKGSGIQMRIPVPDQFCPTPKAGMNFLGGTSIFSSPFATFTHYGTPISSFSLLSPHQTMWEKFSVLPKPDSYPKYRLTNIDPKHPPRVPLNPKSTAPKSKFP
jgi:hypothetical protein